MEPAPRGNCRNSPGRVAAGAKVFLVRKPGPGFSDGAVATPAGRALKNFCIFYRERVCVFY